MASSNNHLAHQQIPILTEQNYEIWSIKMKSLLRYEGVWDVVIGEYEETGEEAAENMKKDEKALCLIHNGLDDIVLLKISAAESSKKVWDILETNYKNNINESRMNNNAAGSLVNLPAEIFVAICAGFVLRLLFGEVPSDSGMLSFVIIQVFAMALLIYVIYKVAGLQITNDEFAAMAIGAGIGMIVAVYGPLLRASMNSAKTIGAVPSSSISIYMILGAILGAIYYDVINKTSPSARYN